MIRISLVFLAALLMAAIIHIATVFSIPYFATDDIWHKTLDMGPLHKIHAIASPEDAIALSTDLDPAFVYGLCRADLDSSPTLLTGQIPVDFWSLNYLDQFGRSQFGFTNQISGTSLNVVLATKGQQRLLSERPDLTDETAIVITAAGQKGLLLLRAFVESERDRETIVTAVSNLSCAPLWTESTFE